MGMDQLWISQILSQALSCSNVMEWLELIFHAMILQMIDHGAQQAKIWNQI